MLLKYTSWYLLGLKTTEQSLYITNQNNLTFPILFLLGAVCRQSTLQFLELMVDLIQLNTAIFWKIMCFHWEIKLHRTWLNMSMTGKLLRCKLYIIIFITRLLFLFRFPVHHSAAMKKFYSENRNDLILLDWPRCFGDIMMPVEWLWKVMIDKLNENQIKVFSEQRLWE